MHYRLADVGPRRIGTLRLVMGEILGAAEAGEPQQPIVALGQDGPYLAVGDGSQMRTHPSSGKWFQGFGPWLSSRSVMASISPVSAARKRCISTPSKSNYQQPVGQRHAALDAGSQRLDQGSSA